MNNDNSNIRFSVSEYALPNVLVALHIAEISDIYITTEEGEMVIDIPKNQIEKHVNELHEFFSPKE